MKRCERSTFLIKEIRKGMGLEFGEEPPVIKITARVYYLV